MSAWAWLAFGASTAGAWRWQRRRRYVSELRATLRSEGVGGPIPEELSERLRWLVVQGRTLRALLEGPLTALAKPPWAETPWARRERCDAWDLAVVELRRAAWDWRMGFARLDDGDRHWLRSVGLAGVPLTGLILGGVDRTADPWEQVVFAAEPDPRRVGKALREAASELAQFEALLTASVGLSYRVPA